jgi:methylenetetrahydrofolate reductase (NADPH)
MTLVACLRVAFALEARYVTFEMVSHWASVGPLSPGRNANLARTPGLAQGVRQGRVRKIRKFDAISTSGRLPLFDSYPARMRVDQILASPGPAFSVEFFPPKTEEATEQLFATARSLAELELDFVSVTYGAGGSTREGTVEITKALKDEIGLETMAHLSCVGETKEGISATLDRIAEAGIENVFALRGDPPRGEEDFVQPEGGLGSAAELAEFVSAGWDFTIGGACFPEVHPEAPDLDTDLAYLKTKVDSGASFLITQLFFDNQVYFDFVAAARARGIDVPIVAGVIPVASFAQTKRICDLCDASIPPRLETAFVAAGGDERAEFELGIAYAAQQCAELLLGGAPGIHFYALNRAPATRAVLGALRASRPWERGGVEETLSKAD